MASATTSPNDIDIEKNAAHSEHRERVIAPIQLTREQYERLFLEPGGRAPAISTLSQRFGNPTPLAIVAFTLVLAPTATCLLEWGKASSASLASIVGPFYFLGGMALVISGVMEWILGNTFPFVVFITFGGFWLGLAVLEDPEHNILSVYANSGGAASPAYASGIMFYYAFWAVVIFIFFITSLRTNAVFAVRILRSLEASEFLCTYGKIADGNADDATKLRK
ncbi:hypothetical protein VNI00_002566 [Paramarasmius palmivorus]|uniref:Uncharacterized protein n=1 Tax=Paramarasmius palmivorus TaxID=297713 RepID=A0AAW0DUR5_9AGAR